MDKYTQYLTRMTESAEHTTKALIPVYASMCVTNIEKPRILEVGIGSSVIGKLVRKAIPSAYLVGLDINKDNIEKARQLGYYDRLFTHSFMEYEDNPFDLIIFSSVIHEIGSYDVKFNYGQYVSLEIIMSTIIRKAWQLTKTNGHIIIRDGLAEPYELRNTIDTYFTGNYDTLTKLFKFVEQFKIYDKSEFNLDTFDIKAHVKDTIYYEINCPRWLMREFLCTSTWNDNSWDKEIKKRFCFTDDDTMRSTLNRNCFNIKTAIYSSEQYNNYFKQLISYPNEQNLIGFYVAEKEDW